MVQTITINNSMVCILVPAGLALYAFTCERGQPLNYSKQGPIFAKKPFTHTQMVLVHKLSYANNNTDKLTNEVSQFPPFSATYNTMCGIGGFCFAQVSWPTSGCHDVYTFVTCSPC